MKILFAGLGSIGTRHLLNSLSILGNRKTPPTFYALRHSNRTLPQEIEIHIKKSYFFLDDVPDDFDIIFITNPTSEHSKYIHALAPKTKHMFIEKPVVNLISENIGSVKLEKSGVAYVACPLRHTRLFHELQKICDNTNVHAVRSICSTYLPDWRPSQDYRLSYSASTLLGGGVERDLIHEWDYLISLFSFPTDVKMINGKNSSLSLNCNDVACYIASYPSMTVELHLDFFGKFARRNVEIYTDDDVIVGDFINQEVRYLKSGKCINLREDRNDWCKRELEYFFALCENSIHCNINTPEHAMRVLEVALGDYR